MALAPEDLPVMYNSDDALARLHLVLEAVRDGELEVPTARRLVREASVYWHRSRQESLQGQIRKTGQVLQDERDGTAK